MFSTAPGRSHLRELGHLILFPDPLGHISLHDTAKPCVISSIAAGAQEQWGCVLWVGEEHQEPAVSVGDDDQHDGGGSLKQQQATAMLAERVDMTAQGIAQHCISRCCPSSWALYCPLLLAELTSTLLCVPCFSSSFLDTCPGLDATLPRLLTAGRCFGWASSEPKPFESEAATRTCNQFPPISCVQSLPWRRGKRAALL